MPVYRKKLACSSIFLMFRVLADYVIGLNHPVMLSYDSVVTIDYCSDLYTLNKSSNWSSLEIGHPLRLIFAKSM